ncbi:hypothetical protein F7725_027538 [Dissostichus mawsoni]|uniref:Uncharacterized protein n=1 Tax=Dissostichus mawsoni TaxID=36200 RepID=A0A7J5XDA0_DISMA|nr:hypothetical protein F7725_027538 [Dissostichus mawsoni]
MLLADALSASCDTDSHGAFAPPPSLSFSQTCHCLSLTARHSGIDPLLTLKKQQQQQQQQQLTRQQWLRSRAADVKEGRHLRPEASDPNTGSDCHTSGCAEGGGAARTEYRDQYIISYKLNSTWIDPEGVCDRLRTADECTVNPTDQYGGHRGGGGRRVGCPLTGASALVKEAIPALPGVSEGGADNITYSSTPGWRKANSFTFSARSYMHSVCIHDLSCFSTL